MKMSSNKMEVNKRISSDLPVVVPQCYTSLPSSSIRTCRRISRRSLRINSKHVQKLKILGIFIVFALFTCTSALSRSTGVSPTGDTLLGTTAPAPQLMTSSTITPVLRTQSTMRIPSIPSPSAASGPSSATDPLKITAVTPIPLLNNKKDSFLEDEIKKEERTSFGDSEDLKNETQRERDALQEEGSHHQPVVFIGGPGYVPPNNLRPRPTLDADIAWPNRFDLSGATDLSGTGSGHIPQTRFPYPLQSSPWDRNYRNPFNMTRVQHIEAECQDDFMKLRVSFNGSFQGLIYSSGFAYDNECVYVNGTGRDYYEYLIRLNRCGTLGASNHAEGRKEPSKNFMWNTVTVQYNPMIEEEWDEHFKVTCEYGYDFWKTVTFKPFDVEVATGNPVLFTLSPPECYMEVRYGFGAAGSRVGGPVRVGDPLTLMIYMRSQYDGFDLVVNDCYAHDGGKKRIQLIDNHGCPVDSKLMSPFRGTWSHTNVYETQVYAYLKTFRFTGSPALYIECDVRMCQNQCPSQPCYWRNIKNIQKRSVSSGDSEKNSSLSESINLSQALTVLQDQDDGTSARNADNSDNVCIKAGAFTAILGICGILLVTFGMISVIACYRLRRVKEINDENSDSIRPFSHHASQNPRHHHPHNHRHWSTTPSSLGKTRVP